MTRTVKAVFSGHSKTDKTMVLNTNGSLMKVESIAECSLGAGLILAQNDAGPLKWANDPYPIQIHANFQILMGHLKFFMGSLQNLICLRILNIHIRA